MLNIPKLLEKLKQAPFEDITIVAPHTGQVNFAELALGTKVHGPVGTWKEKPGTKIATIEREKNPKVIYASQNGTITVLHSKLDGQFVEAGTELAVMRHALTRDEVLGRLLRQALYLFTAPERAKYYFTPDVDKKIRASGPNSVTVQEGMEVFIMSRMKREVPLCYSGPSGIVYAVYFKHTDNVDAGQALIGVCPPEQLPVIEEVVMRVQTEWKEE